MIEKKLRDKIADLIARAPGIANVEIMERTEQWTADGEAWVTETANAVNLAVPDCFNEYRTRMGTAKILGPLPERVRLIASLLRSLLADIDAGLVSTVANVVRAETFDNFLDHAIEYRKKSRKDEAGAIADIVYEDTMRNIYSDKINGVGRPELDQVIIELNKKGVITDQQAMQARVGAHVRTKASHPDWNAFDMDNVDDTIKITKTLIDAH